MNIERVSRIVALSQGGASQRRIAQALGISRSAVRRALQRVARERAGVPVSEPQQHVSRRPSQLDAYDAAIRDLLARYPDITAQRVHEELRRLGYTGGYTVLSVRVRALRPHPRRHARAAVRDCSR